MAAHQANIRPLADASSQAQLSQAWQAFTHKVTANNTSANPPAGEPSADALHSAGALPSGAAQPSATEPPSVADTRLAGVSQSGPAMATAGSAAAGAAAYGVVHKGQAGNNVAAAAAAAAICAPIRHGQTADAGANVMQAAAKAVTGPNAPSELADGDNTNDLNEEEVWSLLSCACAFQVKHTLVLGNPCTSMVKALVANTGVERGSTSYTGLVVMMAFATVGYSCSM